jgi:tetrahydromethanopterin S-methyltransferase subunit B
MYFLALVVLIGAVTINNSLNVIKRNTSSMELYAQQIFEKTKKLDIIINNLKRSLTQTELSIE